MASSSGADELRKAAAAIAKDLSRVAAKHGPRVRKAAKTVLEKDLPKAAEAVKREVPIAVKAVRKELPTIQKRAGEELKNLNKARPKKR